ncbi:MAG: hypothetical protein OEW75_18260 [Cyclobacteriaceae bacterium]|nr:hypothetical protein [Cyclobacteriaceae bacterium]
MINLLVTILLFSCTAVSQEILLFHKDIPIPNELAIIYDCKGQNSFEFQIHSKSNDLQIKKIMYDTSFLELDTTISNLNLTKKEYATIEFEKKGFIDKPETTVTIILKDRDGKLFKKSLFISFVSNIIGDGYLSDLDSIFLKRSGCSSDMKIKVQNSGTITIVKLINDGEVVFEKGFYMPEPIIIDFDKYLKEEYELIYIPHSKNSQKYFITIN